MTPKRIRVAAAILLVGALALFLWNRHGSGRTDARLTDLQSEKPKLPATSNNASEIPLPVVTPESPPGDPARPSVTKPPPDYQSGEFAHVPEWMPRPANAVSASAEDASLRSDGFVEGTLRLVFHANQTGASDDIKDHLTANGMSADADGLVYASENPPRRCEMRVETTPDGGMLVSLSYQGIDHEKGCLCPTCGKSPENPKP